MRCIICVYVRTIRPLIMMMVLMTEMMMVRNGGPTIMTAMVLQGGKSWWNISDSTTVHNVTPFHPSSK